MIHSHKEYRRPDKNEIAGPGAMMNSMEEYKWTG